MIRLVKPLKNLLPVALAALFCLSIAPLPALAETENPDSLDTLTLHEWDAAAVTDARDSTVSARSVLQGANSFETATPVELNTQYECQGSWSTSYLQYFKFSLADLGYIRILSSDSNSAYRNFSLYDSSRNQLDANLIRFQASEYIFLLSGDYYLVCSSFYDESSTFEVEFAPYTQHLTYTAAQGDNDNFSTAYAMPIQNGQTVSGFLTANNTKDSFVFGMASRGTVLLNADCCPQLGISIRKIDNNNYWQAFDEYGSLPLVLQKEPDNNDRQTYRESLILDAGIYIVHMKRDSSIYSILGNYSLTLSGITAREEPISDLSAFHFVYVDAYDTTGVTLRWEPEMERRAEGYIIYRADSYEDYNNKGIYSEIARVNSKDTDTHIDTSAEQGRRYYYRIDGYINTPYGIAKGSEGYFTQQGKVVYSTPAIIGCNISNDKYGYQYIDIICSADPALKSRYLERSTSPNGPFTRQNGTGMIDTRQFTFREWLDIYSSDPITYYYRFRGYDSYYEYDYEKNQNILKEYWTPYSNILKVTYPGNGGTLIIEGVDSVSVSNSTMHRLYNPNSGEHFYTADSNERDILVSFGWTYEGSAWNAPASGDPVYRMYNPYAGDHHYTPNAAERDMLVSVGWNYEGVGWYSDSSQSVPLYRLYNPNAITGAHHYTTDAGERDFLKSIGWNDEGVGWYGM